MSFAAVIAGLRTLTNPYPGLRPFEAWESHLFFGRDQQVAELVARLERHRFLAVIGVSGSGKSSLVRAGLIPALERGGVLEAGQRWRTIVTRPGGAPLQRLAADLERAGLDASPLTRSSRGLIDVSRALPSDESLLVLVDQFEELFRYKDLPTTTDEARLRRGRSASDAAEFVQLLLEAGRHPRPVYVVLTMRSDYLGDCAEFRDLPETLNDCQYLIPRMTRAQRKEAIEVPLGVTGIAPNLVQRLLNDAGDEPDQLPVLQHALMRTWSRWRAADPDQTRRIELSDYEGIGGFENAIDHHAEEVFAGAAEPAFAETIFRRLTAGGRGHRERRDPATLDELCAVCGAATQDARGRVGAVVDRFRLGDATFLTPRDGAISGSTYIDITHESLIRQWRRLRDMWLPAEQQSAKAFLFLVERARNWEAGQAEPLAGLDLADALDWDRRRNPTVAWAEHYADAQDLELVRRFIGASKVHDRRLRLRTRGLWVAAPLALVFAALTIVAVWQAMTAARLAQESRAGKLLARSQLLLTTQPNPMPSVLLAIEALRQSPSTEAEQALRQAVARVPPMVLQAPLASPSGARRPGRLAVSADGRSIAVVIDGTRVAVHDARSGREITATTSESAVLDVAPGPAGTWVMAIAGPDDSARLVSIPDGREIRRLAADSRVTAAGLSRDGRYAATVSGAGWRLHDLRAGSDLALPVLNHMSAPTFSPDGTKLAVGTREPIPEGALYKSVPAREAFSYTSLVFDTATRGRVAAYKVAGDVRSQAFSRDGRFLVTAGSDGAARVFDLSDGSEPARVIVGTPLLSVAISDDARMVATAGEDGTARVFETEVGSEVARVSQECREPSEGVGSETSTERYSCQTRAVAISGDGRLVFSSGDDMFLRVFETLGASDAARITEDLPATAVAFGAAGRRLVVGSGHVEAARLRVFDHPEWQEKGRFDPPAPEVTAVALSANGRFAAVASNWFGGPWLYDLDTQQRLPRMFDGPSLMSSVALDGNADSVAWIANRRAMRFDQSAGKAFEFPGLAPAHAIALSDDGRTAAVGTGSLDGGSVVVFQSPSGTETGHVAFNEPVMSVTISPDGRWVAASGGLQSFGAGVHLVDVTAGRERWKHPAADNTPVAFSRDGSAVAMASADGTLRAFETRSGRETFRAALEQPITALTFDEAGRSVMAVTLARTITGASGLTVKRFVLRRDDLVAHACARVTRNLTDPEWRQYVGSDVPPNATCGDRKGRD